MATIADTLQCAAADAQASSKKGISQARHQGFEHLGDGSSLLRATRVLIFGIATRRLLVRAGPHDAVGLAKGLPSSRGARGASSWLSCLCPLPGSDPFFSCEPQWRRTPPCWQPSHLQGYHVLPSPALSSSCWRWRRSFVPAAMLCASCQVRCPFPRL